MKIILAGYNIDQEIIAAMQSLHPERGDLTPETIAAAYARISRNPAPVNELRAIARAEVEKARISNKNIVFEMGHSSIAEHAVFNIDVIGASRLLVEEIERARLASYTEKSQRYVLLSDDFVVPGEIAGTKLEWEFVAMINRQNSFYHELYARLRPYMFARNRELASDPANVPLLEGWAKEDARYCLSLATETQLGMTINARGAELMIRRLASSPLAEARRFSGLLYETISGITPSLVRYTNPTPYDQERTAALAVEVSRLLEELSHDFRNINQKSGITAPGKSDAAGDETIRLLGADPGADERIAAAIITSVSQLSFAEALDIVAGMQTEAKKELFKTALHQMKSHNAAPREFEHASLTFELIVSATCFAQLKRHRMATLTAQEYNPALGITIPPSVRETGMEEALRTVCAEAAELAGKIGEISAPASAYILTNAHRRRVVMTANARELYHIARVRADRHAQWDIRLTAGGITALAREALPLTMMLSGGKDEFDSIYSNVFG